MSNPFNARLLASGLHPGPEISSLRHHSSRTRQFFWSLSVSLSPLFNSSGSLISNNELYEFLVRRLGGVDTTVSYDGTEFRAILLNDTNRHGIKELWKVTELHKRKDEPAVCAYQCIDHELESLLRNSDPSSTCSFVTKLAAAISMKKMDETPGEGPRRLEVNPIEASILSEALVGSQLKNDNIIKPSVYILAREVGEYGTRFKGVHSLSPYQGVGNLYRFGEAELLAPGKPILRDDHSFWNEKVPFREAILMPIIKGAILGLQYMHKNKFVHGDFKLENVIVCEDPNSQELGYTGKLIDFGISCKEGAANDNTGTYSHLAPEDATRRTRNSPLDIWSLGANLYWLFTSRIYRRVDDFQEFKKYARGGLLTLNKLDEAHMKLCKLSESLKELIRMLLVIDPNKRPDCDKILKAPWFKECDEVIHENKDFLVKEMRNIVRKSAVTLPPPDTRQTTTRLERKRLRKDRPVPIKDAYLCSPTPLRKWKK